MKYVYFRNMSIMNFLSIGREAVHIEFKDGITIITGVNKDHADRRNGVGKSTIADALHFVIFSTTIRELKKDLIVNNITNGTCSVELVFDVVYLSVTKTYKIVRTLNPGKCYLFENGVDITRDSIANTTAYICDLIEASPSIFQNCVIMTLNGTTPFMAQGKVEKRKFTENIFAMQVFSKMLAQAREDYTDSKKMYEMELFKFNETQANSVKFKAQRDSILVERRSKVVQLDARKKSISRDKEELSSKLQKIPVINVDQVKTTILSLNAGMEKCQSQIDDLIQNIAITELHILNYTAEMSAIGTSDQRCPTCLNVITSKDLECIAAEKQKIQAFLDSQNTRLTADRKSLKELQQKKAELKTLIQKRSARIDAANQYEKERTNIIHKIDMIDSWAKTVDDDIEKLLNNDTEFDTLITEHDTKSSNLESRVKAQLVNVNVIDSGKFIMSEEGVKSYIIKKILQLFNNKIQFYLKRIGFNCSCKFNEYFEEEILNEKGKLCSYFNFSGAERKSIDLACLFTFIDIRRIQGNVSYNVVFYDELFDTSLDEKGVEIVCGIITERARKYNENAHIITHRKDSSFFNTCNVINLEKKNGITRRVA